MPKPSLTGGTGGGATGGGGRASETGRGAETESVTGSTQPGVAAWATAAAPAAAAAAAPHSAVCDASEPSALSATSGLIDDCDTMWVVEAMAPVELVHKANATRPPANFLEIPTALLRG
jgi:hypothetical protein